MNGDDGWRNAVDGDVAAIDSMAAAQRRDLLGFIIYVKNTSARRTALSKKPITRSEKCTSQLMSMDGWDGRRGIERREERLATRKRRNGGNRDPQNKLHSMS